MQQGTGVSIESALPKPWEETPSFNDLLYDWMERAPWLAISAVAHVMAFLLLAVIPWHVFETTPEKIVLVQAPAAVEEVFEDPVIEPPPVVDDVETPEDPQLQNAELDEIQQTDDAQDFEQALGEPDHIADSPLQSMSLNDLIGTGGGAGGKTGGRFGGGRTAGPRGGRGAEISVTNGLNWLADHQNPDGSWDAEGFDANCPSVGPCEGSGHAEHDVGVTGLALLAFLGDGHTTTRGKYRDNVVRAVKWLYQQQDFENGLYGERIGTAFLYDHSIATLAMCEAYYFSKSPVLLGSAKKAIGFVTQARNPYGVWRYDVPSNGDNDTSVTGWMIFALKSAEEAGIPIDSQAFPDALTWFDEVTDPSTGRVGYSAVGEPSSRIPNVNDHYPRETTEAMTAVGLLCRIFLGQTPQTNDVLEQHAELLLRALPEWDDEEGLTNDLYYWYYGTYAMYQLGGRHWQAWNKAMKAALIDSQESSGHAKGSWDPNGPWGHAGGRVYSTALGVLCLEVYYRYGRVLGAR